MATNTQTANPIRQPAWKELVIPAILWLLLAGSLSYLAQVLSTR